ncbi:hypothetical protein D9M70_347390 [compost metagenome]
MDFQSRFNITIQELHCFPHVDVNSAHVNRMFWFHGDYDVMGDRWLVIAITAIQDRSHVIEEQYFIEIDRTELNFHQMRIKIQSILFQQSIQNYLIGVLECVHHKRHTDEMVLDDLTPICHQLLTCPARFWRRSHDDLGQGRVIWTAQIVIVHLERNDVWFGVRDCGRLAERHLPGFNLCTVCEVKDVEHQQCSRLIIAQGSDVHNYLLSFLDSHFTVPAQRFRMCLNYVIVYSDDVLDKIIVIEDNARDLSDVSPNVRT